MADLEGEMYTVGALVIKCPRCEEELSIPIKAGLVSKEEEPSKVYVRTDADVADYWLHAFLHREGAI